MGSALMRSPSRRSRLLLDQGLFHSRALQELEGHLRIEGIGEVVLFLLGQAQSIDSFLAVSYSAGSRSAGLTVMGSSSQRTFSLTLGSIIAGDFP